MSLEQGKLFITGSGAPKMQMFAETLTTFFTKTMGWQLEFVIDDQEWAGHTIILLSGQAETARKKNQIVYDLSGYFSRFA